MKNYRKFLIFCILFIVSVPLFSQDIYLELNLNESRRNSFVVRSNQPLEVFQIIEKATNDNKISGIVLNIGTFIGGRDYLWEIRTELERFKANGKNIIAFISNANTDTYLLASVADKIVMDELGTLNIIGYSMGRGYVRQTMEKLGIGVNELRYFEYKSAADTFTRDSLSEADKKQYNDYLDDIFSLTKNTMMNARNWTEEKFDEVLNRDFIYSAQNALSKNIVDYTGRTAIVLDAVNEIEGKRITNFVLYGDTASSLTGARIKYTLAAGSGGIFGRPQVIAVVYANGQTDMETGMAASSLSRTIRRLADDIQTKAIVLRINSPGGSAEAADYINEAVRYAKTKKPVVVSMGEVAASGGYWAAMSANHIVANPYTVTGSIGVIGSWFYDNGFAGKIGFNTDVIKRGIHSDLMTGFIFPYRNLTNQEEERYKNLLMDIYNTFTNKVAAGRNMEIEKVEAVAQGRIFSGIRALEAGLIDSTGGLTDAIRIARTSASIPDNVRIIYKKYPEPKFMDKLMGSFPAMSLIFKKRAEQKAINSYINLLFPGIDIHYRLEKNGHVMPILPLEFYSH